MKTNAQPSITSYWLPFTKVESEDQRLVGGYATTAALDSDGQVTSVQAVADALADFLKAPALREMHVQWAAGKVVEAKLDEKGLYILAKVVDDQAWEKVKEGVYRGFSIGGKIVSRAGNVIQKILLKEISLVDRPANPEALIEFYKADKLHGADDMTAPAAPAPAPGTEEVLAKSLWDLGPLAQAAATVNGILTSFQFEQMAEGHPGLDVKAKLQAAVTALGEALVGMAAHEVAELAPKAAEAAKAEGSEAITGTPAPATAPASPAEDLKKGEATKKDTFMKSVSDRMAEFEAVMKAMKECSEAASKMDDDADFTELEKGLNKYKLAKEHDEASTEEATKAEKVTPISPAVMEVLQKAFNGPKDEQLAKMEGQISSLQAELEDLKKSTIKPAKAMAHVAPARQDDMGQQTQDLNKGNGDSPTRAMLKDMYAGRQPQA